MKSYTGICDSLQEGMPSNNNNLQALSIVINYWIRACNQSRRGELAARINKVCETRVATSMFISFYYSWVPGRGKFSDMYPEMAKHVRVPCSWCNGGLMNLREDPDFMYSYMSCPGCGWTLYNHMYT
jgi:hypothetical protein